MNKKITLEYIEEREEWVTTWMDGTQSISRDLNDALEELRREL